MTSVHLICILSIFNWKKVEQKLAILENPLGGKVSNNQENSCYNYIPKCILIE